jgi:hypothetical protein
MTLPVTPDVETVLRSCAETVRDILLPEVESEWGRYSGELCVASIEYAIGLLAGDRSTSRRDALQQAIDGLRGDIERLDPHTRDDELDPWTVALEAPSPFVAASMLLVASQNEPGPLADRVREVLHPVLYEQLDGELAASMPLFAAFARNISGK